MTMLQADRRRNPYSYTWEIPIGILTLGAVMIAPAVAEQVRQDPCSAYDTATTLATTTNTTGTAGFGLPKWGTPRHQSLTSPAQTIPATVKALYVAAADRYRVPWQLLAGIGMAETRHGRNNHTSSAGAQGLMQFMPRTFAAYGVDGNHDGRRDIHADADSIFSAAHYLTATGVTKGAAGVIRALWAYNHSITYRNDVLSYAWAYAGKAGPIVVAGDHEDCGDGAGDGNPDLPPLTTARVAAMFAWAATALRGLRCINAAFPAIKYVGGRRSASSSTCIRCCEVCRHPEVRALASLEGRRRCWPDCAKHASFEARAYRQSVTARLMRPRPSASDSKSSQ